jgi:hypothetical protein
MKKEILIEVLLLMLGLMFIFINIIVYLSKGNTWFISKKLKLGALILSFTSIFSCTPHSKEIKDHYKTLTTYEDSLIKLKQKKESILNAEKQKKIADSIALIKQKKDSIYAAIEQKRILDSIKAEQKYRIRCYVNHRKKN